MFNLYTNTLPTNEGLCGKCAHKEICAYRDRYCAAQAAVDKLLFEADWAMPMTVECKHYMTMPEHCRIQEEVANEVSRG